MKVFYLLALLITALDQLAKWLVIRYMELGESIAVVDSLLYITSHRNRGAAFGILQNQQWLFIAITIVVVLVILYYLRKNRQEFLFSLSLSLILGGALGNLIDRVRMGEVVDFVDVRFFPYIFNLADSAIVIGVTLFVLDNIMKSRASTEPPSLTDLEHK